MSIKDDLNNLSSIVSIHIEKLFKVGHDTPYFKGEENIADFLDEIMQVWSNSTMRANCVSTYVHRVSKWSKSIYEDNYHGIGRGILLIKTLKGEFFFVEGTPYVEVRNKDGREILCFPKHRIEAEVSHVIPLFPSSHYSIKGIRTKEVVSRIIAGMASIKQEVSSYNVPTSEGVDDIENYYYSNQNQFQIKETNMKTKLDSAVSVAKNSTNLALNISAGNATNAIVKAALRPALEPVLRKALEPKGVIQRTLGKTKVEDSISTLLDSPLMDVLAAAVLVGLTSSGLVTNEKLVKGAALSADAAMLKLAGLIDFDTLTQGLIDKIGVVVASLDEKAQ